MVGRFAGEDQDRNSHEARKLPRRLRLQKAAHESGTIGFVLAHEPELVRRRGRRLIGHLSARNAPWPGDRAVLKIVRRALGEILADRRPARFDGKNTLYQVWPRIGG